MKLNQTNVPEGADAALIWATHKEFDMRYRRYKRHLIRSTTASFQGLTMAMKRFGEVFRGEEAQTS